MDKGMVKGRKGVWISVITLFVVGALILVGYRYVVPRMELRARIIYQEGALQRMNVRTVLTNIGTVEIRNVNFSLRVKNENGVDKVNSSKSSALLPRGGDAEILTEFRGDQVLNHTLDLSLTFRAAGRNYRKSWEIKEDGGYIRQVFVRGLRDWFP